MQDIHITLCLVVHSRMGNLANALGSVGDLADAIIVVEVGNHHSDRVRHLSSEFDAQYIQVPDNIDQDFGLNAALSNVHDGWVFLLHHEEIFQSSRVTEMKKMMAKTDAIAFDLPVFDYKEPSNYYLETRLIRAEEGIKWDFPIRPTLDESIKRISNERNRTDLLGLITHSGIISLGKPEQTEGKLREQIRQISVVLEDSPDSLQYWYYLAEAATFLEDWDLAHGTVEKGLAAFMGKSGSAKKYPEAVNGLVGMFCTYMAKGEKSMEKTVDSLLVINNHMDSDGRMSLPLGYMLMGLGRISDAMEMQYRALDTFFISRRYFLPIDDGLFKPLWLLLTMAWQQSSSDLLKHVIKVQMILKKKNFEFPNLLMYIYKNDSPLFEAIHRVTSNSIF